MVFMKFSHRVLVYALVTAIIEVPSIVVLYSFPNNLSETGYLAFLIVFNLSIYFLWGIAMSGPEVAAPQGSWVYPLIWLVAGVVGMFIIVAVIGEAIVWLSQEIRKMKGDKGA